jgi:hypothetical protein
MLKRCASTSSQSYSCDTEKKGRKTGENCWINKIPSSLRRVIFPIGLLSVLPSLFTHTLTRILGWLVNVEFGRFTCSAGILNSGRPSNASWISIYFYFCVQIGSNFPFFTRRTRNMILSWFRKCQMSLNEDHLIWGKASLPHVEERVSICRQHFIPLLHEPLT